jgi:hypothetical protein
VSRHQERTHERLLDEIAEAKVVALRRIAGRLEDLLADLASVRLELDAAPRGEGRAALLSRFNAAREQARRHRWFLEVQREALGLLRHESLDVYYRVPAPMRD